MDTTLRQPSVETPPNGKINLSNSPIVQEPDHYLKPDQDQPIKGDSGGITFEGSDPDFPFNPNDGGYGDTQNDVNDSTDSHLSTDLSQTFGEYGSIFADIIKQLESIFGDSRNLADNVNQDGYSSNPFRTWLQAISGIADKIGDGTEQTNLTNALNQIMSFYMQQISAAMQNQFNIQQWQIQNDYNSPAKQLERLSAAGLNPLHFFDSKSTGSSTSVTASSGNAPSAASAALGQTKSQRVAQGIGTALGVGSSIASTVLAGKQVAIQAAKLPGEITKQALENINLENQAGYTRALAERTNQETANLAQQYGFNPELVSSQLQATWAKIRLDDATTSKTWEEKDTEALRKEQFAQALKIEAERWLDEHHINEQQLANLKANYKVLSEQAKSIKTATDLSEFRNDFQRKYGIPAESDFTYIMALKLANGEYTKQEFLDIVSALQDIKTNSGNINISELMGTTGAAMINKLLDLIGGPNNKVDEVKEFEKTAVSYEQKSRELLKHVQKNGGVPDQNSVYYGTSRP